MASEWYYLKGEKQNGPVSSPELKKLAGNGTLEPSDYVWKEGMQDWVPAKRLKGLHFGQQGKKATAKPASKPATGADDLFGSGEAAVSGIVVPTGDLAASDVLKRTDDFAPNDALVPVDEDDAVPIDDAVATDDAVPIDQAVADDAVASEQPVAPRAAPAATVQTHLPPNPGLGGACFLAAGAAFLVLAFFAPWWALTVDGSKESSLPFTIRNEAYQARLEGVGFYVEHREEAPPLQLSAKKTYWIWGRHVASGIWALILGLLILALTIVFAMVRMLQYWAWIFRFACIIPAAVMIVLFLLWLFETPGENVEDYVSQGVSLGPYLILVGGLIHLVVGIVGGIVGVGRFNRARRLRQGSAY